MAPGGSRSEQAGAIRYGCRLHIRTTESAGALMLRSYVSVLLAMRAMISKTIRAWRTSDYIV